MRLELKEKEAKIVSVNPRAELHGEDPKPACDVKIEVALTNSDLALFHPSLKGLLYVKDQDRPDLVSQDDPGHATMLRFPQLGVPMKWEGEMIGAEACFHYGTTEKSHIKLPGCVVGKFALEPLEGGTVMMNVQVQCHPDEKQMGRLGMMVGTKLPVTITPPEAEGALVQDA
jgi:hypothetical protein